MGTSLPDTLLFSHTLNGFLLINKPTGPSSHDMVARVRKWAGQRRVGHTGTLDPLATGLLVICMGTATRLSEYLLGRQKAYRATVRLGHTTDTYDAEGVIVDTYPVDVLPSGVNLALDQFRGQIQQIPPVYSAIKRGGQPAYRLARQGCFPKLHPRPVEISTLTLIDFRSPYLVLDVRCSAGTYIRSLAHDLGQTLGCGAHLAALTRTAADPFTLEQAHLPEQLEAALTDSRSAEVLLPPDAALSEWPSVQLDQRSAWRISHGTSVPLTDTSLVGLGRAYNPQGELIAVVEADPVRRQWHPRKVFVQA